MIIDIEKIVFPAFGFGRDKNSRPIFVYRGLPGDQLEVEILKDKKSYAYAKIKKIIRSSNLRIEPKCPHFDTCGGCDFQNLSYQNQLTIKEDMFLEILNRAKIDIKPEKIIAGSCNSFFYRNSIRFFFTQNENKKTSFARHHFLEKILIPINSCLLQSEAVNEILSNLKKYINNNFRDKDFFWQVKIREGKFTGNIMVEIITTSDELPNKEGIIASLTKTEGLSSIYHTIAPGKSLKNLHRHLIFGSPIIFEKIGSYKFQISPESFFQTNSSAVKTLYDQIKIMSEIKIGDTILDLYSGTGSIGIYLSTLAKKILAVELVPEAILDAKDNTKLNKIHNIEFYHSDVLAFLNSKGNRSDILIVDPPRAGLDKDVIKHLSKFKSKRVIYISCNPPTFARDIKIFENYGLKLIKVQPIDVFPQTHHLECIGVIHK